MPSSSPPRITVTASTRFMTDQSDPANGRYVFAYRIVIINEGDVSAQLVSRHWIITDAEGLVQEVRGLGVVGEQPVIAPGERFEYSSGCALATPVGTMRGSYQMLAAEQAFDAQIPEFLLAAPRQLH